MNNALDVHPKVVGGGLGSAAAVLVVWLLGLAHVTVDPVVAGALVAVLASIGGWLAPVLNAERAKLMPPRTNPVQKKPGTATKT